MNAKTTPAMLFFWQCVLSLLIMSSTLFLPGSTAQAANEPEVPAADAPAEILHHSDFVVTQDCTSYTITGNYYGGVGNKVVTISIDPDDFGPLPLAVVGTYTFYGVQEDLGYYTKTGSLPVQLYFIAKMYPDEDKNGVPDPGTNSNDWDEFHLSRASTCTPTATLVPPTDTPIPTNTPVPPTATATPSNTASSTPVQPTATPSATSTNTPLPPTATATVVEPPTATATVPGVASATPTKTVTPVVPPTATVTVPPTVTPTATPSKTPVLPTATPTRTSTATATATATPCKVDCAEPKVNLGNQVWFDTNNNGHLDAGEVGAPGVAVILSGIGGTQVSVTDSSGYYTFTELLPGTYSVSIPAANFAQGGALYGYCSSTAVTLTESNVDSDDNGQSVGCTGAVSSSPIILTVGNEPSTTTVPGDSNWTVDFGFYKLEVGNQVWIDGNNNGILEPDEIGLANVQVTSTGPVTATTVTDNSGFYTFTGLLSGTYSVCIESPSGFVSSKPDAGSPNADTGDSNDNGEGNEGGSVCTAPFTVQPGSTVGGAIVTQVTGTTSNPNIDFGLTLVPTGSEPTDEEKNGNKVFLPLVAR